MPTLEYKDETLTLEIESEVDGVLVLTSAADADAIELLNRLRALDADANLDTFEYKQDGADPLHFEYGWQTSDGRTWMNEMQFDSFADTNPLVTFDVPEGMRQTEYLKSLPLRQLCVQLTARRNVRRIECEWK